MARDDYYETLRVFRPSPGATTKRLGPKSVPEPTPPLAGPVSAHFWSSSLRSRAENRSKKQQRSHNMRPAALMTRPRVQMCFSTCTHVFEKLGPSRKLLRRLDMFRLSQSPGFEHNLAPRLTLAVGPSGCTVQGISTCRMSGSESDEYRVVRRCKNLAGTKLCSAACMMTASRPPWDMWVQLDRSQSSVPSVAQQSGRVFVMHSIWVYRSTSPHRRSKSSSQSGATSKN